MREAARAPLAIAARWRGRTKVPARVSALRVLTETRKGPFKVDTVAASPPDAVFVRRGKSDRCPPPPPSQHGAR